MKTMTRATNHEPRDATRLASLVSCLALMAELCSTSFADPIPAPADWGIFITNCTRTTRGVSLGFWTAQPPPYFACVYPAFDYADGGYLAKVACARGLAFIPGDFTDTPVWVKVITAGRVAEVGARHRQLTAAERADYTAVCNAAPGPDRVNSVKYITSIGSSGMGVLYTPSLKVYRYFSVGYDGIVYTNTATAANSTINFKSTPLPSAVSGEERIKYWPVSTYSGTSYNPAANNSWCVWTSNSAPEYLMYKNGPIYRIPYNVTSNVTPEQLEQMIQDNLDGDGTNATVVIKRTPAFGSPLELIRGQVLSRSNINPPELSCLVAPDYSFVQVTNTTHYYEYNGKWYLHPLDRFDHAPGREILWQDMNHGSNTSNAVYLPRLFKGVPSDGARRATTDFYGRAIVVTNAPNHWATMTNGVFDVPPVSNELFRIHFAEEE